MPKFDVDIPHQLSPDEVKARIDGATGKIESAYGATCRWTSEHELTVSRKGFDAVVAIEASRIHVDVNLAFLLSPMASSIKSGLARELSALVTTTAAPAAAAESPGKDGETPD